MQLKAIFIPLFGIWSLCVHAQTDSLIDSRDNQSYPTVDIMGTVWMTNNLNLETERSLPMPVEKMEGLDLSGITGRFYHYKELQAICPCGWELPSYEDWFVYFEFWKQMNPNLDSINTQTVQKPYHHFVTGFQKPLELFLEPNPLNLTPVGRYQGTRFIYNLKEPFVDYWTVDAHIQSTHKTHTHLRNSWSNIHDHDHHLRAWEKRKLRRFMVRCIKSEDPCD